MGPLTLHQMGRMLAVAGRGQDRHLVHVSDAELKKLKEWGGSGAINPHTGLMEFDADSGGTAGGDGGAGGQSDGGGGGIGGDDGAGGIGGGIGGGPGSPGTDSGPGGIDSSSATGAATSSADAGVSTDAGMAALGGLTEGYDPGAAPPGSPALGPDTTSVDAASKDTGMLGAAATPASQNSMGYAQFDTTSMPSIAAQAVGMALGLFGGIPGTLAAIGVEPGIDAALGKNPATTESLAQEAIAASPFGLAIDAARGINYGVDALGLSPPGTANPDAATSGLGSAAGIDTSLDPNKAASLASSPATTTPTNTYLARGTL